MEIYNFKKFKENINEISKQYGEFYMEVLLTDFFCLHKQIQPELIYITQIGVDGKIDAIVVSKEKNKNNKNIIYIIQISTSFKDEEYINEYIEIDPFKINKYNSLLLKYKENYEVEKVLITLKNHKCYKKFSSNCIEILSNENDELYKILYTNCIKFSLIDEGCKLKDTYIKQLKCKEKIWEEIHRTVINEEFLRSYIYVLTQNYRLLINDEFNFINEIKLLLDMKYNTIIEFLKSMDEEDVGEILNTDERVREQLLTIYSYGKLGRKSKNKKSIIELVKTIYRIIDSDERLYKLDVRPTRTYISIDNLNRNIAYLYYEYAKNVKKAIFCFSCTVNEIKCEKGSIMYNLIKEGIIRSRRIGEKAAEGKNTVVDIGQCNAKDIEYILKSLLIICCNK